MLEFFILLVILFLEIVIPAIYTFSDVIKSTQSLYGLNCKKKVFKMFYFDNFSVQPFLKLYLCQI